MALCREPQVDSFKPGSPQSRGMSLRRGQAAIEYLALIGIVLLFATPLVLQTQTSAADLQATTDIVMARNAMDTVADGARFVFAQGEPSTITFDIQLPRGVVFANVTDNYIRLRMDTVQGGTDLFEFFAFNVSGAFPTAQGRHTIVVAAAGQRNVTINEE